MEKRKIEKLLIDALKGYITKGNYFYRNRDNLYRGICCYLKETSFVFSKSDFNSSISQFNQNIKNGWSIKRSSKKFLYFLSSNSLNSHKKLQLPELIQGKNKKNKGFKNIRYIQWEILKKAWDMLNNPDSTDYLNEDMRLLVAFKSHLIEPYRSFVIPSMRSQIAFHPYIMLHFGIPTDKYEKDVETKNEVDAIDAHVGYAILYLRHILNMIPWIIKQYPQASLWMRDIFGDSANYYNLSAPHRKSYNRPKFKDSHELFVQFINGKTYKQLGFNRNEGNKFVTQYRPQGALYLLHQIHVLLYGLTEEKNKIINNKKREIKKIFESIPTFLREELLNELNESIL